MKKISLILNVVFVVIIIVGGIVLDNQHKKVKELTIKVQIQTMENFAHKVELSKCQEKLDSVQHVK